MCPNIKLSEWKLHLLELSGSKSSRTTPLQNFRIWKAQTQSSYFKHSCGTYPEYGKIFFREPPFCFCARVLEGFLQLARVTLHACDAFVSWGARILSSHSTITVVSHPKLPPNIRLNWGPNFMHSGHY